MVMCTGFDTRLCPRYGVFDLPQQGDLILVADIKTGTSDGRYHNSHCNNIIHCVKRITVINNSPRENQKSLVTRK